MSLSPATTRLVVVRNDGVKALDVTGLTRGRAIRYATLLRGLQPDWTYRIDECTSVRKTIPQRHRRAA